MPHAESPVASLIALDWGTTNLRAWLLDPSGEVIAEHQDARGMAQLQPAQFEPTFVEVTAPWRAQHGVLPAIACGMVGARARLARGRLMWSARRASDSSRGRWLRSLRERRARCILCRACASTALVQT